MTGNIDIKIIENDQSKNGVLKGFKGICNPKRDGNLACDTPILTQEGWKKHGDLQVGDSVYTPKGSSKVIANHHFLNSPCMKVQFRGNQDIICGTNHS